MPFITRNDAAHAYDKFVKKGLPDDGREFEKALVRILFREISGSPQLNELYLDHKEYRAYEKIKS